MANSHLSKLMELITDVSEDIPNGTYLEMCNVMKDLYNDTKTVEEDQERHLSQSTNLVCPYTEEELITVDVDGFYTVTSPFLFNHLRVKMRSQIDTIVESRATILSLRDVNERIMRENERLRKYQSKYLTLVYEKENNDKKEIKKVTDKYKAVYVNKKNDSVECTYCKSWLQPSSMKKHLTSKKCLKAREMIDANEETL